MLKIIIDTNVLLQMLYSPKSFEKSASRKVYDLVVSDTINAYWCDIFSGETIRIASTDPKLSKVKKPYFDTRLTELMNHMENVKMDTVNKVRAELKWVTGIGIFNHESLSGSSMEKALQNMKDLGIDKRVLLIKHNLLTPFTMGTKFDLTMSNLVFHNLGKNRFKAYDNVIECLNSGGYFILIDLLPEQSIDMDYLRNNFSTATEIPITGNGKWDLQMKVFQKI